MGWLIASSPEGPYSGYYGTKELAIQAGLAQFSHPFWVGESRPPSPLSAGIYADAVIEAAMVELEEDWGLDFCEFNVTEAQVLDLQAQLRAVVDAWVANHGLTPQWQIIDNPIHIKAG